jgi:magnesium-transporting ATPase (P-type)
MRKADLKKAFILLRNGVALCFTWLVILLMLSGLFTGALAIKLTTLLSTLFISFVGVICFIVFFSDVFIRDRSFIFRLSFALIVFVPAEIFGFYLGGFFEGKGSLSTWLIFAGIVLFFYSLCIIIDKTFCKKKGEEYTFQLMKYQEERKNDSTGECK